MTYDPFSRGPFPVGVRTTELDDPVRAERRLPVEAWYPATPEYAGQDLADPTRDRYRIVPGFPRLRQDAVRDAAARPGSYPLLVFSHGYGSHRRQSTFFCTHLASHGYVAAAVEHTGNTVADVMQAFLGSAGASVPAAPAMNFADQVEARPRDVIRTIDALAGGAVEALAGMIDTTRIGVAGHSFGGWTALATPPRDARVRALLPLAPAGGSSTLPTNVLRDALRFDWGRDVPTLLLVAERDSLLPLAGMYELLDRVPSTKRMAILENADHMHFCDDVERTHEMFRIMPPTKDLEGIAKTIPPVSEFCPGWHGHDFIRGLGLAHLDAVLRDDPRAQGFLAGDLRGVFGGRGIAVRLA